eukprot:1430731-Prymnesium_polylepis.1
MQPPVPSFPSLAAPAVPPLGRGAPVVPPLLATATGAVPQLSARHPAVPPLSITPRTEAPVAPKAAPATEAAGVGGATAPLGVERMTGVDAQSMRYLTRKLVNLVTLLEQDTACDDRSYMARGVGRGGGAPWG